MIYAGNNVTGDITIEAFGDKIIYKVIFDANGGNFSGENTLTFDDWNNNDYEYDYKSGNDNIEKPTRDGYEFLGYYTEKIGGTFLANIMAESGIDTDMTFYAQWKEVEKEESESKKNYFMENYEQQEFVIGTDTTLLFILNTDRSYGKVFVDGVELSDTNQDYTWHFLEGEFPSITLSENYMKTLKVGTHTIKFIVDNGVEAETTFTIVESENIDNITEDNDAEDNDSKDDNVEDNDTENNDVESDDLESDYTEDNDVTENKPENKPANKTNNPQTGDNILLFIGLLLISVIGIGITTKFRREAK